ncbi:hypothetical protein FZEAL_1907 [Fusarium zealandicum]|uniref:Methyltransferase n=1 Tax=Fusarium zealandicum TaxID=1053134 RepID=A0A8H4URT9_9HYPO|nr:hypothetical protein FZEAL_1907 [Fusarium zealandicum]
MDEHQQPPLADKSSPETTFRSYNLQQGMDYAQYRRDYHPKLYKTIINYHRASLGQFGTILDIGCGPGRAVRTLAPLGTASPVTRWREAHPETADTEQDVVRVARRKIEQALYKTAVKKGVEMVCGEMSGVLLMLKKRPDVEWDWQAFQAARYME